MRTSDFDYYLPEELIAQTPVEPRDHARMMAIHRCPAGYVCNQHPVQGEDLPKPEIEHRHFYDVIDYLNPGDALVINETKVIPARLIGAKAETGVPTEVLLLRRLNATDWDALVRPGRRLKPGTRVVFGGKGSNEPTLECEIMENVEETGGRIVRFHFDGIFEEILDKLGEMPLPPYIHEKLQDSSLYQTVYAKEEGSAAAPTAGLHFTPELMDRIKQKGIEIVPVLLHVGLGTFRPVQVDDVEDHVMHSEWYQVTKEAADKLNSIRQNGGRLICVGTTSVRTIETVADDEGIIHPGSGDTAIFIKPGVKIKAVDGLITNFHLPQSTLLMLVSTFMGRQNALDAYNIAVNEKYRFFSFGDCMTIL